MTDQYVPALRQRFLEDMQIKGLQPKTQTMYLRGMRDFTGFLGHAPDTATPEELRAFQLDMKKKGVGAPTFNNRLTVLSFFFAATCPRPEMKRHMRYQRVVKKIPVVLSVEEVAGILEAAPGPGLKYRAAFSVAYGGGLRASEVTHLKVEDIDSDRMLIRIEQGKGRKDRQVMLSPSLLDLLREYYREARPKGWMFPGRNRVDPIWDVILPTSGNRPQVASKRVARVNVHRLAATVFEPDRDVCGAAQGNASTTIPKRNIVFPVAGKPARGYVKQGDSA